MQRFSGTVVVWCLAGLGFVPPSIDAAAAADRSAVRLMMERSGFVEQLSGLDAAMQSMLRQMSAAARLPGDAQQLFVGAVTDAFDGDRLVLRMEEELTARAEDADVGAFDAFYASDVGLRLFQAEMIASEQARGGVQAPDAKVPADAPERDRIFDLMGFIVKDTETAVALYRAVILALMTGIAEAQPGASEAQPIDMASAADAIAVQANRQLRTELLNGRRKTYEGIATADLRSYIEFLQTRAALDIHAVATGTSISFVAEAGRRAGRSFAEALRQKRT